MSDSDTYEGMSIKELREIIEKDTTNYEAQYVLAKMLIKLKIGNIQENQREAFELLNMVIKNNEEYLPAWYLLGYCYEYGIGIDKNDDIAIKCYVIASKINDYDTENGYAPSQYKIARLCEKGEFGFKKNYNMAFELYYLSSKNGYIKSRYRLALCYKNGIGTPKDIIKSKYLLEELVKSGYNKAQNSLDVLNRKRQCQIKRFLENSKKPKKEPAMSEKRNKKDNLDCQLQNILQINKTLDFGDVEFVCPGSPR